MSSQSPDSVVGRYTRASGQESDERYSLTVSELRWLVEHCARLSGLRVQLLRALQTALPMPDEQRGVVSELKEVLTDLIIMQNRLASREERVQDLLDQLIEAEALDRVTVDEALVPTGMLDILRASDHVRTVAGHEKRTPPQ